MCIIQILYPTASASSGFKINRDVHISAANNICIEGKYYIDNDGDWHKTGSRYQEFSRTS